MKKATFLLFLLSAVTLNAQYGTLNKILDRLEERRGINHNLAEIKIDQKKFVLITDFEDHTERKFLMMDGPAATYVEIFDDKETGKSASNVFSGDIVRSKNQVISLRADVLEGKKIPVALTKTFLLTRQKDILYLIDINSKERWIEENSLNKKKK